MMSRENTTPNERYEQALGFHREGQLARARLIYRELLLEDGTREPDPQERRLVRAFAPQLYVTDSEPFPLKDFAAVLHPRLPLIGYHMFWDADIDFPAGNDACDHEVVWVLLDDDRRQVKRLFTFYHGTILTSDEAAHDARSTHGRVNVFVQWGKHGSLPVDWEGMADGRVRDDMVSTYRRLHTEGCRDADHPLAQRWPDAFRGQWEDFVRFDTIIDPVPLLEARGMVMVGEKASAIIALHFLRYCFAVKESWPDLNRPGIGVM